MNKINRARKESAKKMSTCTSTTSEDDLKPSLEATEVCLRIKPKGHLGYRHSVSLTDRGSIVLKNNTSLHQEGEAAKKGRKPFLCLTKAKSFSLQSTEWG